MCDYSQVYGALPKPVRIAVLVIAIRASAVGVGFAVYVIGDAWPTVLALTGGFSLASLLLALVFLGVLEGAHAARELWRRRVTARRMSRRS